jgi:para-nitrobenzyl esterase
MNRRLGRLLAAMTMLFGAAHAQIVERPIAGDPVAIDSGLIAGKTLTSGVRAYFGVPFAAPPVRRNRWREPQPVSPWTGVYNADRFAPECIQPLRSSHANHYFGEEPTSEDCLYLNIWAPPGVGAGKRPVVVWIYGGGFGIGSSSMANYAGESLAKKGVVYVGLNYRVGPFGFLAHPALTAESPRHASGNYGLLDQLAALRWIQRNIAGFGGDPGNVTIVGQSAGAMSVSALQASPLGKGLFRKVVGMSGSLLAPPGLFGTVTPLASAEQAGLRLQALLKVDSLDALRAVPADRVLQAGQQIGGYGLVIDGWALPAQPSRLFADGRQSDTPILIGFTRDESFSPISQAHTLADYRAEAQRLYGQRAEDFLKLYPAANDAEVRSAATIAGRDGSVAMAQHSWAEAQAATGKAPVYAYMFSRVQPYAPGITFLDHDPATVGAYHAGDIPYWLQTLDSLNLFRTTRNWTTLDRDLADRMSNAIVAFAERGEPRGPGLDWPKYDAHSQRIIEFGDQVRAITWPDHEKLSFFAAAPAPPAPLTTATTGTRPVY